MMEQWKLRILSGNIFYLILKIDHWLLSAASANGNGILIFIRFIAKLAKFFTFRI